MLFYYYLILFLFLHTASCIAGVDIERHHLPAVDGIAVLVGSGCPSVWQLLGYLQQLVSQFKQHPFALRGDRPFAGISVAVDLKEESGSEDHVFGARVGQRMLVEPCQ